MFPVYSVATEMNEEGGYLGAMTYQCLYSGILDKLRSSKRDDDRALAAIHVSFTFYILRTAYSAAIIHRRILVLISITFSSRTLQWCYDFTFFFPNVKSI